MKLGPAFADGLFGRGADAVAPDMPIVEHEENFQIDDSLNKEGQVFVDVQPIYQDI